MFVFDLGDIVGLIFACLVLLLIALSSLCSENKPQTQIEDK